MAAKNDVTGDNIQSRGSSKAYADNWEAIFGKNKPKQTDEPAAVESQANQPETDK